MKYRESRPHDVEDLVLEVEMRDECLEENLGVWVTGDVGDRLRMLVPWRWVYVEGEGNFAVPSNTEFMIDIISCSKPASLYLAKSFPSLFT